MDSDIPPVQISCDLEAEERNSAPIPWWVSGATNPRIYLQYGLAPLGNKMADAISQIQAMRDANMHLLRIFVHQEDTVALEIPPAEFNFEPFVGQYDDKVLGWIDRLMPYAMGDPDDPFDDVKLLITLFDSTLVTGNGEIKENVYFKQFGELGFYTEPQARDAFKKRIEHILLHKNPCIENKAWKDLDIIAGWEPANEPGVHSADTANPTTSLILATWLEEMASYIKSIDTDETLVVSGTSGRSKLEPWDVGDSIPDLVAANPMPSVDVHSLHLFGIDVESLVNEAKSALPGDKRVWVEAFGDTRDRPTYGAFGSDETTIFGSIHANFTPWLLWKMGPRTDSAAWDWFVGDKEWSTLRSIATMQTSRIEDFSGTNSTNVSLIGGASVATELRDTNGRGQYLRVTLPQMSTNLRVTFASNYDLRGRALTFRARANTNISSSVRLLSGSSGDSSKTSAYPVTFTENWSYFQVPLQSLMQDSFTNTQLRGIGIYLENTGSADWIELDDFWVW